ncbi:cysteine--tRNA ligase [Aciditerrimonas ferrireducens]|uniref:Cysteine--tRNA ligase n=1 Tax=Aciditerrimonas ferrireducens TaxID=667306 RepID=A0ABV6C576_9ACTN
MELYDTARRAVVPFRPGRLVTLYSCGITPYDAAHLGHAQVYLTFDVLHRRLLDAGHHVRLVRNVTDVDDDILRRARELGVFYLDLAAEEMARFDATMDQLGLLPVAAEPRATSAIPEVLSLVQALLDKGHAYRAAGAVYYSVASFPRFGALSGLRRDEMLALAAERGGRPDDPAKADPLDFVLWQPSGPGEPSWSSRWGPGRPGWHIECSALAMRELGETVDLHGGGSDLVFPHHECEVAQSEAVTGRTFVRHWLHVGMVRLDGVKMSKSLGNLVFADDLLKEAEPAAVRLALLAHHYREDWDWRPEDLLQARDRLARWRQAPRHGDDGALAAVRAHLDRDLDCPGALAALDELARAGRGVLDGAALLGITL